MKTPAQIFGWIADRANTFEETFATGKFGQAAMAVEQIYTVLCFIGMEQEAEQIMTKIGWKKVEKVFAEARVNVKRGSDQPETRGTDKIINQHSNISLRAV